MAYQPIQRPKPHMLDAMGELSQSLSGLADWKRQREQDRLEQERQQRGGFANAYMQAQALMHKGDYDGARMLLAPYAKNVQTSQQEVSPSMPMSTQGQGPMGGAPPAPQGGSAMPDALEFADPGEESRLQDLQSMGMGQGMKPASRMVPAQELEDIADMAGIPKPPEAKPLHPLFAARQADHRRTRTILRGTGPDGQAFTMDPEAQREAELQESHARIAPVEQAVSESGDPIAIEAFKQIKPWLLSGKVDTGDALKFINDAKETEARRAASIEKERQRVAEKEGDREYAKTDWAEKNKITSGQSDRRMATQAAILAGREGVKEEEKRVSREVLDDKGNVIGEARTDDEAKAARIARTALEKARVVAQDLKAKLAEGRLLPIFQSGKEADRAIIISQLTELRKQVTGAENEADAARYKQQLSTAWNRGPEEAMAAVDQFVRGAEVGYNANVRSIMRRGATGSAPPAPSRPANKIVSARALEAGRAILKGEEE